MRDVEEELKSFNTKIGNLKLDLLQALDAPKS